MEAPRPVGRASFQSAKSRRDGATPRHEAVEREQNNRADDGAEQTCRASAGSEQHGAEPAAEDRAQNTDDDRDDDATRVFARHDELGNAAGYEADNDPHQNAAIHDTPPLQGVN